LKTKAKSETLKNVKVEREINKKESSRKDKNLGLKFAQK
jgi:hypothetical protein